MSTKQSSVVLLVSSITLMGVGFVLTNSTQYGICETEKYSCREFFNNVGDPMLYGFSALALVFLVLVFVPRAFPAWKKFAICFVPLAALLFAFYPYPGSGDFFSPYPEQIFQWVSVLYVIISVAIIARSKLKGHA